MAFKPITNPRGAIIQGKNGKAELIWNAGCAPRMPATLKDMKAKAGELVSAMRAEMSASAGQLTVGASHAAGLRMAGAGTTVYNDNRMEQSNTYNVPVATPSEVAKKQREALRNMVGGVK